MKSLHKCLKEGKRFRLNQENLATRWPNNRNPALALNVRNEDEKKLRIKQDVNICALHQTVLSATSRSLRWVKHPEGMGGYIKVTSKLITITITILHY